MKYEDFKEAYEAALLRLADCPGGSLAEDNAARDVARLRMENWAWTTAYELNFTIDYPLRSQDHERLRREWIEADATSEPGNAGDIAAREAAWQRLRDYERANPLFRVTAAKSVLVEQFLPNNRDVFLRRSKGGAR